MLEYKINPVLSFVLITVAAALLAVFLFLGRGQKKVSLKIFILYTLGTIVGFGLVGLIGLMTVDNALSYFIILQACFLALGIIHCFALYYLNDWSQRESFWHEFIFTLFIAAIGAVVFYLLYNVLNPHGYSIYFLSGMIFFILPFFVLKSFDYLIAIPQEEYTKWYYPVDKEFEDLDDEDLDDKYSILLGLSFERSEGSTDFFTSSAKSPLRWIFSDYFARYLWEFNDANPGKKIQYLDKFGQPIGWNFYVKPRKWYQTPRYIDPQLTINENGLEEKDVIVCERVL